MKRIVIGLIMLTGCIGLLATLTGAETPDRELLTSGRDALYARFFLDPQKYPNQVHPDLSQLDSGGDLPYREVELEAPDQSTDQQGQTQEIKPDKKKEEKPEKKKEEKQETKEKTGKEKAVIKEDKPKPDTGGKRRGVFNFNLMAGSSFAYFQVKRVVTTHQYLGVYEPVDQTWKNLGIAPGLNVHFIFNVAKYFALGFGGDANYFYLYRLSSSYSSPLAQIPLTRRNFLPSKPEFYLEVPVYGLMRFYFSDKFRAAYLVLGGGIDFFLLGRPVARSIIARGGIGFTLDNGFMMEFLYQYNTDPAEDSRLVNIKDMHRGMVSLGYCFNAGVK